MGSTIAGKVIIITGASKGIGKGCAKVFCEERAKVVICARGTETGEALAKELNEKTAGECIFKHCDVSDPDQIKKLIEFTIKKYDHLDCIINNAGWHPPHMPIDDFSVNDFNDLLQLNLVSIFAACKYALPYLRKTKGNIINMASLVGVIGQKHATTYVSTKSAIIGLTKALAVDEADNGVRVNSIAPAGVDTPLIYDNAEATDDPDTFVNSIHKFHHLGRMATPEEIGKACLFLASDLASFVTGVNLHVSGGAELDYGEKSTKRVYF